MALVRLIWRAAKSLLGTLVFLVLVVAVLIGLRLATPAQTDNEQHLAQKAEYLDRVRSQSSSSTQRPNIVFVLYDDLGYGDLGYGAAGSTMIATPHIDTLAANGVMLTDFHSPSPVCTPSRAGYLTGRLAPRAGLPNVVFPTGSRKATLFQSLVNPDANIRLPAEEITLADLLSAAGYATGMVGKWHLGDRSPSLPNDMGFDSYYGALYSNDMEPFALYADKKIAVPAPVDQTRLTEHYTRAAVSFIEEQTDQPFFLYFAHNFPHDPLHVRDERLGTSRAGLFGDVIEEIDDSIGSIVDALERTGQLDNTLILITSDNGPWFLGDAGNQRGRKGLTYEGGMRVPFIAHWPARIQGARVENAMAMGIDLFPTVLELLNLPAPSDRELDGRSMLSLLTRGGPSAHDYLYYYDGESLIAVRDQRFKYRGAHGSFYGTDQMPVAAAVPQKEWLFDLAGDAREAYDTSAKYPRDLKRLREVYEAKQRDMADNKRGWR